MCVHIYRYVIYRSVLCLGTVNFVYGQKVGGAVTICIHTYIFYECLFCVYVAYVSSPPNSSACFIVAVVCYSVLQCVALCCIVLQCVAVCCSVLHLLVQLVCSVCAANCALGSVVRFVAVCCSVLQCVAVCCSVLQCVAVVGSTWLQCVYSQLCSGQCFAVCWSVLECVAVCCV